jgi:hypothetical protein
MRRRRKKKKKKKKKKTRKTGTGETYKNKWITQVHSSFTEYVSVDSIKLSTDYCVQKMWSLLIQSLK